MTDLAAVLEELRAAGLFRELREVESAQGARVRLDGREVVLLCSNDYLGLAGDARLRAAAAEYAERWGAGAGASRLVSGGMVPHRRLEEELAAFKGTEACLLFGSGFLANTGVVHVDLDTDVDAHCAHAREAGATIEKEPADEFYGARSYRARDREGHVWTFAQTIREVSREEAERVSGLKITGWV